MYFNNIHILWYVLIAIFGGLVGQFIDYVSKCFLNEEKIFSSSNFKNYKKIYDLNVPLIFITAILYVILLYFIGINNYLTLCSYLILLPMLLIAFIVDYKEQIIPNRLNLTIFEIGIVFTFLYGIDNLNISKDMLLGMCTGAGIFLIITLLGGLIAGKEAMGFGDVKLMGAIGLYFGFAKIIIISVTAFLIAAIIAIILLIFKKNKLQSYIPFGPFIVIGAIISMIVPVNTMFNILMEIFSLGMF